MTTDSKFAPKLYLCHTGIGDGDWDNKFISDLALGFPAWPVSWQDASNPLSHFLTLSGLGLRKPSENYTCEWGITEGDWEQGCCHFQMCSEILQGPETFLHGPQTQREVVGLSPLQPLPYSWVSLDGQSLATHSMASSLICVPQVVRRVKVTLFHSALHPCPVPHCG